MEQKKNPEKLKKGVFFTNVLAVLFPKHDKKVLFNIDFFLLSFHVLSFSEISRSETKYLKLF